MFSALITLILFLLVIVCVTPLSFLSNIRQFKSQLSKVVDKDSMIFMMVADQITPIILMLFNYQFIPFCVNKTGEFSDFELKSDKHISNMRKYYFFLLLNTIILPISGITTMGTIMQKFIDKRGILELHTLITNNLVKSSTFFIRYVMSCTFFSSCFLIFDIGHQMYRLFVQREFLKGIRTVDEVEEDKMKRTLSAYKDVWYFDMGYHIAFTQIIFLVVIIFSSVAPLITPLLHHQVLH